MKRGFNSRMAAILLLAGVLLLGLVIGLHRLQATRSADLFLTKARKSAEAKDWPSSIRSYQSYARLRPNAPEPRAELGKIFYEGGQYEDALRELEHSLRLAPDDRDSRRIAAHSALLMGRYPDARVHLDRLLTGDPDAELLDWLGRCQRADLQFDEAVESFASAAELSPDRLQAYVRWAEILDSQLDERETAETVLKQMVARNPKSPPALLTYSQFLQNTARQLASSGDLARARVKFAAAAEAARATVALDPTNSTAQLLLATSEFSLGNLDAARDHAIAAQQSKPESPRAYLLLADVERAAGDSEQILNWLTLGIENVAQEDREGLFASLATYLLDLGQPDAAKSNIVHLSAFPSSASMVEFLQARVDMANAEWLDASEQLESVRPSFVDQPAMTRQIDFMLGQCYVALQNTELAITALRRAIVADRSWAEPRSALVEVLEASGQIEAASEEMREMMRLPNAPSAGWLRMAQRSIATELRSDPANRDWSVASECIDQAEKTVPERVEIPLYRAEILLAQGRADEADDLLVKSLNDSGAEDSDRGLAINVARSGLAQRQEQWDQAAEILATAEDKFGDRLALRLARASYLAGRFGDKAGDQLRDLKLDTDALPDEDKTRLMIGIGASALRVGDTELCQEIFDELEAKDDTGLEAWILGYDLAIANEDAEMLRTVLDEIEEIGGQNATWSYGQAQLIRIESDLSDPGDVLEAMNHLIDAERQRPGWTRPLLLKAQLLRLQGNSESAIAAMTRAINLGVRTPEVIRQNIALLFESRNYQEANRQLNLLGGNQIDKFEDLQRISSRVSAELNDFERALNVARRTATDSTDFRNHLWLAELTSFLSQQPNTEKAEQEKLRGEAEQSFRAALELGTDQREPWGAFVRFLVANDRRDEVPRVMDLAATKIKPDAKDLFDAQCYELLGEIEKAATALETALQKSEDPEPLLREMIEFDLRHDRDAGAEERLRELIALPGATDVNVQWGRRQLAMRELAIGGKKNLDKAMQDIELNLKSTQNNSVPDLRVKATIFAMYNDEDSRSKAIKILEGVLDSAAAAPMDHYRAAQLLLASGNWPQAAAHIRSAIAGASQERDLVTFKSAYVSVLLDRGEFSDAEMWLRSLEKVESAAAVSAGLQAQLFARQGQHGESVAVLQEAFERESQQADSNLMGAPETLGAQMVRSALQLEAVARVAKDDERDDYHASAEEFLRKATKVNPRNRFAFASYLARREKYDQALDLLEGGRAEEDEQSATLAVLDRLARSRKLNQQQLSRLDAQVRQLADSLEDPRKVLLVRASIQDALGQPEAVHQTYREILQVNPDDLVALNNLALSLSLDADSLEEAAQLCERAIEIAGRNPTLLDTRAVIAMEAGDHDQALEWLLEATGRSPSPVLMLHRAAAHLGIGDDSKAIKDFQNVESAGLDVNQLDQRDRAWFDALTQMNESQQ